MSALPEIVDFVPEHLTVVTAPPELVKEEELVVRQSRALIIASEADYNAAGTFLNTVIVAGKKKVHDLFDKHVKRAFEAHRELTADRAKHLAKWEEAERIVKDARVKFFREEEERRQAEQRERERVARALEEERKRQEAEAERQRADAEAARIRKEAEDRRVAAEAEAERLRNIAAEQNDRARAEAEQRAKEIEEEAARETAAAEVAATSIAESGEATAQAIAAEPVHLALPTAPSERLAGVAKTWGVDKTQWNVVEFAKFIAADPVGRAKYIGEPAWKILDAEAKQLKSQFDVPGIVAGPKYSGRAGGR